ncbi:SsrA-binding protein [Patescibacteria group bacterium]|nr:SsrA-binding protein [Patescibacteria group bacterium]MCG2702614.1 SsrA-binding protein [Candidatus Parcubacteria bacterium]MBU4265492.1 SsrA-binding protein [Patescibacteria group bacterium]MBU4390542.1 SsrA-binding protein [Patescibacteria group bacterium]MBU4430701.1 SsrA-binding protein [Patescibacteria group bacterium]
MNYFNKNSLDYKFIEKFEAGLVLTGSDAKSLRTQGIQFGAVKVEIINNRPFLINLDIPLYKFTSKNTLYDTTRNRALLLNYKQIAKLISYRKQKYMIIPISIYIKNNFFKAEIGIGRKMRKYEKRQKIKDKEMKKKLG